MKKILIFVAMSAMCFAHAGAAVRDGNITQRSAAPDQKRISTTIKERTTTQRNTLVTDQSRTAIPRSQNQTVSTTDRDKQLVTNRSAQNKTSRSTTGTTSRVSTIIPMTTIETKTGAEYENCKNAYFTCMDQFCALKNDDYRRCSCSNRVYDMDKAREKLIQAGEQLTVFNENLDIVGLTTEQATAMRTASEGENALSKDTSASKALLQAIMNSISGGDTTVGGKYSDLNTVSMSYDLSTSFGADTNQLVATYNGLELYTNVYPQCRRAVAADCNNASLQRAINAYLMAIEQDCNTVQTAITEKQRQTKTAIRESSAMLDLARVENRQKHNSDDLTTCINNVEAAILSDEVCGENYHKCLDNGEYIDISTGAPIVGVVKFYELRNMLSFTPGVDAAKQQLANRPSNQKFVKTFENRTKKFAEPALDKCTEIADTVWSEYLNKAMLSIYYAQQSKVDEITQGCFDFVTKCYENNDGAITSAMASLIGSNATVLQPDKIALTGQMCSDYVESCNNMFQEDGAGDIIEQYVKKRQSTDLLAACRAVVKQCFDKYGGAGYENFYYPYSGLFKSGRAADWFTLYDFTNSETGDTNQKYLSPCANQLAAIDACSDKVEEAFGGFDFLVYTTDDKDNDQLSYDIATSADGTISRYGHKETRTKNNSEQEYMRNRVLRPVGVATEIYNQIISTLTTQCSNINGRFIETQFIKEYLYDSDNLCIWKWNNNSEDGVTGESSQDTAKLFDILAKIYGISQNGENMCPRNYTFNVDTKSWGVCSCWENGGRRSKNGKSATCLPLLPVKQQEASNITTDPNSNTTFGKDSACYTDESWQLLGDGTTATFDEWCTQETHDALSQTCPYMYIVSSSDTVTGCGPSDNGSTAICELIGETDEGITADDCNDKVKRALKFLPKSY